MSRSKKGTLRFSSSSNNNNETRKLAQIGAPWLVNKKKKSQDGAPESPLKYYLNLNNLVQIFLLLLLLLL